MAQLVARSVRDAEVVGSSPITLTMALLSQFLCYNITMFIISLFFSVLMIPATPVSAAELTEDQTGAIVQNCASTKQSLRTLQRTDARARSYLGAAYETLLSDYISPLNLRLINSNQPNADLTNIHSQIINTRQEFISRYTSYAQSLEDLIYSDCQNHPDEFYDKLVATRKKRAELSSVTTTLRNLFSEHLTEVRFLKNSLGGNNEK